MRGLLPRLEPDTTLEQVLARMDAEARASHPTVELDAGTWAHVLACALEAEPSTSYTDKLATLPAADLWLAAAAAAGEPAAIEAFERLLIPEVDRVLRRFALPRDDFDELRQCVRVRLLVAGPGATPRIGQYRGRGSLAGWVRTVATRTALNERRGPGGLVEAPDELQLRLLASTPELAQVHREHQEVFARAFRAAFGDLSSRARNLLRLRHLDDLPLESLARAYQVHVSTASRWLTAARDALATAFTARASAELGDARAVAELVLLVQSRFHGNLRSLLSS
jgi:RNA polymerase sigma-70 factor (ECF subfamily)